MHRKRRGGLFWIASLYALTLASGSWAFTWGPRADVIGEQFGRGLHAGGTINDIIYIAGGGYIGTSLWESYRSTVIYDPAADSWSPGPDMTWLRTAPASAVAAYNGSPRLYVIGGMDLTDFPVFHFTRRDIEEYDPVAGAWRIVGAEIQDTSTWGSCAVTVDNLILIMGGVEETLSSFTNRVAAYDPDADTITLLEPMPAFVSDGVCAAVGRKVYWISGYDETRRWGALPSNATYIYDVDQNTWSTGAAPIPTARANAAAIADGTTIYVVGGWNGSGQYSGLFNTVDAYDTTTDTWTAGVPDPLGCMEDNGTDTRGRAGFTLHKANTGTQDLVFAVGGNIGISGPTRCNESTPLVPTTDVDPPDFAGLDSAAEVYCTEPKVHLSWIPGTDALTPPVVYNIYRGTSPSFIPDATTLVQGRVAGASFVDALTPADCSTSFWYVVRAEDSATPSNEETNLVRVQVDVACLAPTPPTDIANRLFVAKDGSGKPDLDWSAYLPGPGVTHYHVRRTLSKLGLPGNVLDELPDRTWLDTTAIGVQYYYEIRSATDCLDMESSD